jgi:hypothetical protein
MPLKLGAVPKTLPYNRRERPKLEKAAQDTPYSEEPDRRSGARSRLQDIL